MKLSFRANTESKVCAKILVRLKELSKCSLYNAEFEEWAFSEWGVNIVHGNEVYPSHITGIEMDDSTYVLLLLHGMSG